MFDWNENRAEEKYLRVLWNNCDGQRLVKNVPERTIKVNKSCFLDNACK